MSRRAGVAAAAATALALAAPAAAGPVATLVLVEDDSFNPGTATQVIDSSTAWSWGDGVQNEHNVRQDAKLFDSGPATSNPAASFSAVIASGTYHYYCTEHGSKNGGMDGVVKVKPQVGPADVDSFVVTWGDVEVPVESQYDVQYRVGSGDWKDLVKNKTAVDREFGADDKPVDVKPGKTYRFRARTEKLSDPDKRSDFSPVTKHTVQTLWRR